MALLKGLKLFLMVLYRCFQLLDVFRPPFAECRLSLTIPLLPLLRRRIDLVRR